MNNEKCVLAYSGGLDTSAIVPWLIERGHEVHAVLVDVGQNEDLPAQCEKALRMGAQTAVIRDARPAMFEHVVPCAIGLAATYEGNYRLGTALARPFIALEQVRRARELGGATLVHGATGKGNDQIRFEYAYRSLAPEYPVLAPWKVWDLSGRRDLIAFLQSKGFDDDYAVTKDFSFDENLWHLSVEGGDLEDPAAMLDVESILAKVSGRFAGGARGKVPQSIQIEFNKGVPTALDGRPADSPVLLATLNKRYRHAPWSWDLVIENRQTGIKSRGLYINPAAKLLNTAVDALARCTLNKASYDEYVRLGSAYGAMLYRGEFFSDQREVMEAAARVFMARLTGMVIVQTTPQLYAAHVDAPEAIFRESLSTFQASSFEHRDAAGFIHLSWLSAVGRSRKEECNGIVVEAGAAAASDLCEDQSVPGRRLVPAAV
jgi:argininosuccinate synthase